MNVLTMMRRSHALRFVPGWNRPEAASAFANVSCTRSSASGAFPVIRSAAGYRLLPKTRSASSAPTPSAVTAIPAPDRDIQIRSPPVNAGGAGPLAYRLERCWNVPEWQVWLLVAAGRPPSGQLDVP